MVFKIIARLYLLLDHIRVLGLKKYLCLRAEGISPARYLLFDKKWIKDLEIETVLDVGANTGEFTLIFHHCFNAPTIHSVEPLPDCVDQLSKIAAQKQNIIVHPFAVGARDCQEVLHVSSHAPASSILLMGETHKVNYPHSANHQDIEVQCKRLDSLFTEMDFHGNLMIKLDVQGFEKSVIEGGRTIFKRASLVVIEMSLQQLYEQEPGFDELYRLLKSLGFVYCGSLKQSSSKLDGSFLQCDGVFVNSKVTF